MGLMTILRKVRAKEREMRILILGLDNAGKTTIVKRLKGEDVTTISPTLGFDINTLQFGQYKLNLWDVGGQQTIRAYWRNYFEQTDAIVWVVDSADVMRMNDCRIELENLLMEERLAGATLLVLANKQDIQGSLSAHEVASKLSVNTVVGRKRHWRVFACSAYGFQSNNENSLENTSEMNQTKANNQASGEKTGPHDNVLTESFQWLVDDVASRVFV